MCSARSVAVRIVTAIRSPSNRVDRSSMRHLRLSNRSTVLGCRVSQSVRLYNLCAPKIGTLKKNISKEVLSSLTVKFLNNAVNLEMRNATLNLTL